MRLEDQDAEKGIVSQSKAFRTLTCRSTCRTTSPCRANPRVLLLSLRKEALQIMAGLPRTFQPQRSSPARINVAKLPINPCCCRLIGAISSANRHRLYRTLLRNVFQSSAIRLVSSRKKRQYVDTSQLRVIERRIISDYLSAFEKPFESRLLSYTLLIRFFREPTVLGSV